MGELRDRMVRDMDVRRFSQRTIESYVAGVRGLAKYYRRPPDQLLPRVLELPIIAQPRLVIAHTHENAQRSQRHGQSQNGNQAHICHVFQPFTLGYGRDHPESHLRFLSGTCAASARSKAAAARLVSPLM